MLRTHRDIQTWVKKHWKRKYEVSAEIDGKNFLPDQERHWYEPDIILRGFRRPREIKLIIEVENDPMRKALVGASILADASIRELQQRTRPRLIFVVYAPQGIRQMQNFRDKLKLVGQKGYCPSLCSVEIYPLNKFKRLRL